MVFVHHAHYDVVEVIFSTLSFEEALTDGYQPDWPIQRVAIINAGPRWVVCPS